MKKHSTSVKNIYFILAFKPKKKSKKSILLCSKIERKKNLKTKILLEQPFIRDSNITVEDYIKQTISILGENIKVKRFIRYVLGELDNL